LPHPDQASCLIVQIDPSQEPEPKNDKVDEFERELYLEHCVDDVGEGIPSENE
jgi:hypothetical protein